MEAGLQFFSRENSIAILKAHFSFYTLFSSTYKKDNFQEKNTISKEIVYQYYIKVGKYLLNDFNKIYIRINL
jgi:hypothetical protein